MIEFTVTLHSPQGAFQPTSFTEHIGRRVDVTGLDPALHHVLVAVENTEDGTTSTLRVQSHREDGPDLTADLSVRWDTPTTEVRAYLGDELFVTARLDAPLQPGQTVRSGDRLFTVADVSHPARRDDGTMDGPDYQRADLAETEAPPLVRDLGASAFGVLLAGG